MQKGKQMLLKCMVVLTIGLMAVQAGAAETPVLKTQKDKLSYSMGVDLANIVKNVQSQGTEVDVTLIMKGLKDALAGSKLLMTNEDMQAAMRAFEAESVAKLAARNKKEGEDFLAKNKTAPGVITLPSGLQYKIITAGTGKTPTDSDTVTCKYRGTFISGTEFDSSDRAGGPVTFQVSKIIPGFTEALKLMPVGSKWQIFVPSQLAYGEQGAPPVIGQNMTLIFEVELVAIK
jgi:FKBP-type peptidyl-prolyl cis-trans isomerase FklB